MTVESKIASVTVFLDRAKITRTAQVTLAGSGTLILSNIPTTVLTDSVRAKGHGTAPVRILGLDVPYQHHVHTPDANAADLQTQLEAFEKRQRELADQVSVEEQRIKMAAALRVSGSTDLVKGLAWGRTTIDSIDALSRYATTEETAAKTAIRDLADLQRETAKEIEALKARLRKIQQPAQTTRRAIQIQVECETAGTVFDLEVSYVCSAATWRPLYDARLLDAGDKVELTYLAMVTQGTGEDWNDVDLALSTARTAATTEIPELQPWYLDVYTPPPPPPQEFRSRIAAAAMPPGDSAPMMMAMSAPAPAPVQAESIQATAETQGASVHFRMPRKTSIPSDNTPHRAQIANLELPAALDYIAAPPLAEQAYLRAKVLNDSGFVLLPGEANLFHGDEYVGLTRIEDTASKEFELQLGVDERISIHRDLVSREVSKAFIGNTRKTQFAYRIRISNQLPKASRITILDQMPHSRHEEIKVKLLDSSPKVTEQTDLSELRWRLLLEPARDQEIQFGFSVEYPRTLKVTGMED